MQVARLISAGRYEAAAQQARRAEQSSAGMRALLGIALVRSGYPERGLPYLEASEGVMTYMEVGGLSAHADALRASGWGERAWAIRSQRMDGSLSDRQAVQTLCQGVDDLLVDGDVLGALTLGEQAIARDPGSPAAHAFLASALVAAGELDAARYHHWLSRQGHKRRLARVAVNEATIAEASDDQLGALRSWERLEVMRRGDSRIAAWHAGWLRRQGQLHAAKARAFSLAKAGPSLLAERTRICRKLGDSTEADAGLSALERRFPSHPVLGEFMGAGI